MLLVAILAVRAIEQGSGRAYQPAQLPAAPSQPDGAAGAPRVELEGVRLVQPVRVGRRAGAKVVVGARIQGGRGQRLDLAVRLSTPSGVPMRATAARYRDGAGGFLATARTAPLQHDDSTIPDLWIFLPYGALDLPSGVHDVRVQVDLCRGSEVLARRQAEGLLACATPPAETPGGADALEVVEVARGDALGCGVCAQEVAGAAWVCPRCAAVVHADCWEYNQGCSAYGCGERL